jgi:hypothetical protein
VLRRAHSLVTLPVALTLALKNSCDFSPRDTLSLHCFECSIDDIIMDLESMSPNTPTSPHAHSLKRPRPSSPTHIKHSPTSGSVGPISPSAENLHDGTGQGGAKSGQSSSSFRNVSACNRCRLRKNRCDQKLPSCASCEKARVACVGYDPITKREIPRRSAIFGCAQRFLCETLTVAKLRLLPRDPRRSTRSSTSRPQYTISPG